MQKWIWVLGAILCFEFAASACDPYLTPDHTCSITQLTQTLDQVKQENLDLLEAYQSLHKSLDQATQRYIRDEEQSTGGFLESLSIVRQAFWINHVDQRLKRLEQTIYRNDTSIELISLEIARRAKEL
jgi:hypothetical protein